MSIVDPEFIGLEGLEQDSVLPHYGRPSVILMEVGGSEIQLLGR